MRIVGTEAAWEAGKGEGGAPSAKLSTRAASLPQVAQSWMGPGFLVPPSLPGSWGNHTRHGCPCLFVPLFVPPQPQTSCKSVLSPFRPMEQTGRWFSCGCIPTGFVQWSGQQR